MRKCSICERKHYGKNFCKNHYLVYWLNNNPIAREKQRKRNRDSNNKQYRNPNKCDKINKQKYVYNLKRKKYIKQRTPKWLKNTELINVYVNCPKTFEIDHIIPLRGENVSGLHVPWNLQILTKIDNIIKSNTFDGTYNNDSWRKKNEK